MKCYLCVRKDTKKYFDLQGHQAGNEQFEPPTDKQDRFDNPAPRRVGRRRFSGGGPERSGGRAAQPRAIRPDNLNFTLTSIYVQ